MNIDLYLFGDFGNGYTQYIDDNTRVKFKSFVEKAKANSQLIIQRDDALIYYTYIRRLHNEGSSNIRYIGISYVLNTNFIKDIDGLFTILEGAVTTIASRGILLRYLPSGQITSNIDKIYQAKSEFAHVSAYLKNELDSFMVDKKCKLPILDFSINTSELKTFKFTDSREEIIKSISTFPTIYIYKDENYDNEESKSYSSTLSKLNKEKNRALETIDKQKQEISDLERKQKNYKLVIWLIIIILIGGFVAFRLIVDRDADIVHLKNKIENKNDSIRNQQKIISIHEDTIKSKEKEINGLENQKAELNKKIDTLYTDIVNLNLENKELLKKNDGLQNKIEKLSKGVIPNNIPIYIKYIEIANVYQDNRIQTSYGHELYSYNTMYLKPRISYVGIDAYSYINLKVKLYKPTGILSTGTSSPKDATFTHSFQVQNGHSQCELIGWGGNSKGHWAKGKYRIEIWYNDICLKEQSFTIY